jgi:phosphoribosylformylglycinamidine cyclo-ligase
MPEEYAKAGVDIAAAQEAVDRIKPYIRSTFQEDTLSDIGLFGGLTDLQKLKEYKDPVLVQSIDGVGTKLQVAEMMGKFDTVGQCLVNHCVDDILAQGAKPLTFLDYAASSKLIPEVLEQIVKGEAEACRKVDCAIVGGETAEMPGTYQKGRHDLVGCITGVVEREKIIDGKKIEEGDVLIGISSNGLHTNGYSLARKAFFATAGLKVQDYVKPLGCTVGEELLKIHKCYFPQVYPLIQRYDLHGVAHITGGGLIDNIARLLPEGLCAKIDYQWEVQPVFKVIQEIEKVSWPEMRRVFNLGMGMVLVVPFGQAMSIRAALGASFLGAIIWKKEGKEKVIFAY